MEKENPPPYTAPYGQPHHQAPYPNQPPIGFAPPAAMSQPPQQVIVNTGFVALGPGPASMTCPNCQHQIRTTVEVTPNTKTHLFALLLCLFGCWVCCCIPYCADSCQSKQHSCPNCKAYIGEYNN